MNAQVINYTPHDINVYDPTGQTILQTYPRSGEQIRLISDTQTPVTTTGLQVPIVTCQSFTGVDCPIIPKEAKYLLVSMPVGQYFREANVLSKYYIMGPDTGPQGAVRDDSGRILGTKRLVLYREASK